MHTWGTYLQMFAGMYPPPLGVVVGCSHCLTAPTLHLFELLFHVTTCLGRLRPGTHSVHQLLSAARWVVAWCTSGLHTYKRLAFAFICSPNHKLSPPAVVVV